MSLKSEIKSMHSTDAWLLEFYNISIEMMHKCRIGFYNWNLLSECFECLPNFDARNGWGGGGGGGGGNNFNFTNNLLSMNFDTWIDFKYSSTKL